MLARPRARVVTAQAVAFAWIAMALAVARAHDSGACGEAARPGDEADAGAASDAVDTWHVVDAGAASDAADPGHVVEAGPREAQGGLRGRLSGRVLVKGRGAPLAAASVSVDGRTTIETDMMGRFTLELAPGPHRVEVLAPGHERASFPVLIPPAGMADWTLLLAPLPFVEPYETVVRAPPPEPHTHVSGAEARRTGAFGDPLRVLEALPGVAQVAWPAALYVVRGANPNNTTFLVDGVRVPAIFHLALGPSVIHPYLVESVAFHAGGYPARYGRGISGLMAAETAAAPSDRVHASVDLRVYDAGALVTTPLGGGASLAVAGRYSYTGLLFSALSSDSTLHYGDYLVRLDGNAAGGKASVLLFGSFDALGSKAPENPIGGGDGPGEVQLQFHRLDVRWGRAVGGSRRVDAGLGLGIDRSRSSLFRAPATVRAGALYPRARFSGALSQQVQLELGVDGEAQRFDTDLGPFDGVAGDIARPRTAATVGQYVSATVRQGPLVLSSGMRLDQFIQQGVVRFEVQPRLAARYGLGPGLELVAAAGRFAQMPSLPTAVPGLESFQLATLGPQTSLQGSLGVEAALARAGFTLGATGYYQRLRLTDVRNILLESLPSPLEDDFLEVRAGRAYGFELLVRRPDRFRVSGWLAYTLGRSERAFEGRFGPSDWDQRHVVNAALATKGPGGNRLGVRLHAHTGRPSVVQPRDGLAGPLEYARLPPFVRMDLRWERRFVFDRFLLDAYVDWGNVTFAEEAFAHERVAGRIRTSRYRIFLPTIGVHGEL